MASKYVRTCDSQILNLIFRQLLDVGVHPIMKVSKTSYWLGATHKGMFCVSYRLMWEHPNSALADKVTEAGYTVREKHFTETSVTITFDVPTKILYPKGD